MRGRVFQYGAPGFTLLELLIGISVLGLMFISLSAYTSGQRNGLNKAGELSSGTQLAAAALENVKCQLADSATFNSFFHQTESGPKTIPSQETVNRIPYSINITLTRAQTPLYALKIRALVSWKNAHQVELGVLYPGAAEAL